MKYKAFSNLKEKLQEKLQQSKTIDEQLVAELRAFNRKCAKKWLQVKREPTLITKEEVRSLLNAAEDNAGKNARNRRRGKRAINKGRVTAPWIVKTRKQMGFEGAC